MKVLPDVQVRDKSAPNHERIHFILLRRLDIRGTGHQRTIAILIRRNVANEINNFAGALAD